MSTSWLTQYLRKSTLFMSIAKRHNESVENNLRRWGLRFDDIMHDTDIDANRAVELLPPEIQEARRRRLARVIEMTSKHVHLDEEGMKSVDPRNHYMLDLVVDLERRRYERETYK